MDIRKIEFFVDLAKTLDYTETAERLFTTQGNVSKGIIALEKELGVSLFDRAHRKITISEEGNLALGYAQRLLKDYQELQKVLNGYKKQQEQHLTIFFIPTAPDYQGFGKISEFIKAHPEIDVELKETEANAIEYRLEQENNAVAFARTWESAPKDRWLLKTEADEFAVILPKTHPLAEHEEIKIEELQGMPFLLQNESSLIYQKVEELCQQAHFEPEVAYTGVRVEILMKMVEKEMGVSILMRKSVEHQLSDKVVLRPLTPNKTSHLSFIAKKNQEVAVLKTFWDYIQTH